jgi:hypothetical protein
MAKFLNLLQFDRKIAMRLKNTKTVLKAPNEIDFNRINLKMKKFVDGTIWGSMVQRNLTPQGA